MSRIAAIGRRKILREHDLYHEGTMKSTKVKLNEKGGGKRIKTQKPQDRGKLCSYVGHLAFILNHLGSPCKVLIEVLHDLICVQDHGSESSTSCMTV
jgi:hypothetical protein